VVLWSQLLRRADIEGSLELRSLRPAQAQLKKQNKT
jgi:hypothetical protein